MANNIPLWFNSGLKLLPFRKSWYQMGYFWVSDIMNEDGILHSRDKMSEDGLKNKGDIRNERPLLTEDCDMIAVLHVRGDGTL